MTTKPTTDDLLAKLAALDVEIMYFGDGRETQGAWLEEGAWVERVPWGDPVRQRDIRRATDAEIIRALAAELLRATTGVEANKAHTALGHAVAKVLPDVLLKAAASRLVPGPHEPDEDGVAECPNCTQSLTRGTRGGVEGLYCSECDEDWEPVAVPADDEVPF